MRWGGNLIRQIYQAMGDLDFFVGGWGKGQSLVRFFFLFQVELNFTIEIIFSE